MDGSSQATNFELNNVFNSKYKKTNNNSSYVRLQINMLPEHYDLDNYSPSNIKQLEVYADMLIKSNKKKLDMFIDKLKERKLTTSITRNK